MFQRLHQLYGGRRVLVRALKKSDVIDDHYARARLSQQRDEGVVDKLRHGFKSRRKMVVYGSLRTQQIVGETVTVARFVLFLDGVASFELFVAHFKIEIKHPLRGRR